MLLAVAVIGVFVVLGTIEILFRCDQTETWPSDRR